LAERKVIASGQLCRGPNVVATLVANYFLVILETNMETQPKPLLTHYNDELYVKDVLIVLSTVGTIISGFIASNLLHDNFSSSIL